MSSMGMEMIEWPQHKASLTLTHNDHKSYYKSVAEAIEDCDFGYQEPNWVNEEQKQKAIDTNECWTLQWYPETPVGFHLLTAADLDVLLEAARRS